MEIPIHQPGGCAPFDLIAQKDFDAGDRVLR
jgi:hypothetical protein